MKSMNLIAFQLRPICCKQFGKPSLFPTVCSNNDSSANEDQPVSYHLDDDSLMHLEELSLVRFSGPAAVHHLRKAIEYAGKLRFVDTENVEPMYTVLENEYISLREDRVTEGNCRDDILKNASKLVEEYFVAPPGNIPLESDNVESKRLLSPMEIKKLAKHLK